MLVENGDREILKRQHLKDGITNCISVYNPYELKVRTDKVLTEILNITRSEIRQLIKKQIIDCEQKYIGKNIVLKCCPNIKY